MTLREYLLMKYHAEAAWPTLEDAEMWDAAKKDMREEAAAELEKMASDQTAQAEQAVGLIRFLCEERAEIGTMFAQIVRNLPID